MALVCSISNETPEHPCISPVSGAVFERRLLEKALADNGGVDPVNGESLALDQLIDVKVPPVVKAKAPSSASIPAALKSLQDEWDAVMLYSFTLRQQLQTVRQELSHALYQHDAACRVIARLSKEVTAAREALATLKPQAGVQPAAAAVGGAQTTAAAAAAVSTPVAAGEAGQGAAAEQPEEEAAVAVGEAMSEEVLRQLQEKASVLTQERKKRGKTVPAGLVLHDTLSGYRTVSSNPGLHSASVPGILSLDVHQLDTSKVVTAGNDRNCTVFNKDTEQVVCVLKGHTKKVTKVVYHTTEDTVLSASPDTAVRVWNVPTAQTVQLISAHSAAVTGLSLHATGDYVLTCSLDQHWAFSDIRSGKVLTKILDDTSSGLTTAQFHPDGLIFGTGTSDSMVKIWDLKERSNVANFPGHSGPVTALSFSENGYYLAAATDDSSVKLWDLRKLKNFKTIQLENGYDVKDLCFDQSGAYLAVAGTDVRVYLCKQWQQLAAFTDHTALATGVRFGQHASYVASVSMDRTLKLYSA